MAQMKHASCSKRAESDMLLQQVEKTVNIFERVHPEAQGLFLFDNAPSHWKVSDDSLNADKMNVGPGGKQTIMCDTTWNGALQTMVRADGKAKGMKMILEERGVDTKNMRAEDMRKKNWKLFRILKIKKHFWKSTLKDEGTYACFIQNSTANLVR